MSRSTLFINFHILFNCNSHNWFSSIVQEPFLPTNLSFGGHFCSFCWHFCFKPLLIFTLQLTTYCIKKQRQVSERRMNGRKLAATCRCKGTLVERLPCGVCTRAVIEQGKLLFYFKSKCCNVWVFPKLQSVPDREKRESIPIHDALSRPGHKYTSVAVEISCFKMNISRGADICVKRPVVLKEGAAYG